MPPVSVTMQPRNLLLAAAVPELAGVVVDDEGELADAQPAASTVAPATTTVMIDFFNSYLLDEGSNAAATTAGCSSAAPTGQGN
jgi:hypothetical protein